MSTRLRIAFIGQRGVPAREGGVERHVEELGARLAARGHSVTVYCRTNYAATRPPEHRGMKLRHLPSIGTKRLDFIGHSVFSTLVSMRRPPDVIHYHALGSALVAPLPRALSSSRIVLTVHGLDYERDKWGQTARRILRAAGWLSERVPHATITVSRALADHYAARGCAADYIPNGVPPAIARPLNGMGRRLGLRPRGYVLFVGRLVPEKAPDLLIRAFRSVPGDHKLVLAGSSGFTDGYAALLKALAAEDPRVVMAGAVFGPDLEELYSNAAAFVLPSSLEGLPITLLEAASHGLPVIVSDIAPHLEIVGADGPGRRVVPRGDPLALARAITEVCANRDREMRGAAELRTAVTAGYSWEAVTSAVEDVYARLLTEKLQVAPVRRRRPLEP